MLLNGLNQLILHIIQYHPFIMLALNVFVVFINVCIVVRSNPAPKSESPNQKASTSDRKLAGTPDPSWDFSHIESPVQRAIAEGTEYSRRRGPPSSQPHDRPEVEFPLVKKAEDPELLKPEVAFKNFNKQMYEQNKLEEEKERVRASVPAGVPDWRVEQLALANIRIGEKHKTGRWHGDKWDAPEKTQNEIREQNKINNKLRKQQRDKMRQEKHHPESDMNLLQVIRMLEECHRAPESQSPPDYEDGEPDVRQQQPDKVRARMIEKRRRVQEDCLERIGRKARQHSPDFHA